MPPSLLAACLLASWVLSRPVVHFARARGW